MRLIFHICDCNKVKKEIFKKSLTDMGFTFDELSKILNFYLFYVDGKPDESLKKYNWSGKPKLMKLEGALAGKAGLNFFFLKSHEINKTLDNMNLTSNICVEHPRALLKLNFNVDVREDETTEIKPRESRMECLLRHIRNVLAHDNTYLFDNGNILLEDFENEKKQSASILIPKKAMLDWINIIKKIDR